MVIVGNGLAGAWALAAHRWNVLRHPSLWWTTAVAEVAIVVQAILGVALLTEEGMEPPRLHLFYGFVAVAAVGIIYSYRQQVQPYRYLLYGLGGLFLMGMGIREVFIGTR